MTRHCASRSTTINMIETFQPLCCISQLMMRVYYFYSCKGSETCTQHRLRYAYTRPYQRCNKSCDRDIHILKGAVYASKKNLCRNKNFNILLVQAKSELGTTKRRNLSHVIFLDQNFMRNKNILGKKPKS